MCCELGNLFNKEAVLTALLEKKLTESFPHIRGLKDLKTVRITENPAALNTSDVNIPIIICPITKIEMNGLHPFVVIWSTGFILSEKAIREVGIDSLQEEYGPFSQTDIIKIIPLESEMDELREAMFYRREKQQKEKKSKKKSKTESTNDEGAFDNDHHGEELEEGDKKNKKRRLEEPTVPVKSGIAAVASEKLVASALNVVKENEEKSDVYKSLFHKGSKDRKDRDLFMTVAGIRYTLG